MKVLITGATGFIGNHLVDELVKQGHEVLALIRNPKKAKSLPSNITQILGALHHNRENKWVKQLPKDLDCVIHIAGLVHSMNSQKFYEVNSNATNQFFKDLKNKYSHLKFIFISSLAASGPSSKNKIKTEKDLATPVSHYGKSKLKSEQFIKLNRPKGWTNIILRPPIVIGPGDMAMNDIFKMVNQGFSLEVKTKNPQTYSFICVYDLVHNIILSLKKKSPATSMLFFTSHPKKFSLSDLTNEIAKHTQRKSYKRIVIPQSILKLFAKSLSLIYKYLPLNGPRLTPDKVTELTQDSWTCSSESFINTFDAHYLWDLKSTVEITFKDYKKRKWL